MRWPIAWLRRHAMVSLVDQGWANQVEVARAFNCSVRTVRRHQQRFEESGLAGLGRGRGYPRGRSRLANWRRRLVQRLKGQGRAQREIARQIGVSENAVRKLLRRLGWKSAASLQAELPFSEDEAACPKPVPTALCEAASAPPASAQGAHPKLSASPVLAAPKATPASHDTDPSRRWTDRLLARLGLLEDAAPLFGSGTAVPRAGVLLALPALVASGVFECAQEIYAQPGAGLLWTAHQPADALAHGAVAHQTAGGSEGTLAPGLGARAGVGPGTRSQDPAPQTGRAGGRRTRRRVWPGAGSAAGRHARGRLGFPLC